MGKVKKPSSVSYDGDKRCLPFPYIAAAAATTEVYILRGGGKKVSNGNFLQRESLALGDLKMFSVIPLKRDEK